MKFIKCNLMDVFNNKHSDRIYSVYVPTNQKTKANNHAVMGAGFAKQIAQRFPQVPEILGRRKLDRPLNITTYRNCNINSFPTKKDWRDPADLELIESSCRIVQQQIIHLIREGAYDNHYILIPFPGIGCGQLHPDKVKPILEKYFKNYDNIYITRRKI